MTPPSPAHDIFESSDELILVKDVDEENMRNGCRRSNHRQQSKVSPISTKPFHHSNHTRGWVNTISSRLASSLNLSSSWSSSFNANSIKRSSPFNGLSDHCFTDGNNIELLKIDPEDVANQLTLIDIPIFQKITKEELLSIGWNTSKKHSVAPNIVKFTKRFNQVILFLILNSNVI